MIYRVKEQPTFAIIIKFLRLEFYTYFSREF